jgi:hypothetical protein
MRFALTLFLCSVSLSVARGQERPSILRPVVAKPPAVEESVLVRRELPATSNQWLSLRQTLALNFNKELFAHPAKADAILLQVDQESVLLEFDTNKRTLRIEGAAKPVESLAKLALAHTHESQVSKDRAFRIQKLNARGQIAMAAFSSGLIAGTNGSAIQSGVRLASGAQEPVKAPSDEPPDRLPLPQFEGVQIEMLPELDAVILRGRDQQLTDLSEIIKRLDQASRESKPTIEVVPLQHVNSESMSKLIDDIQEKFLGTRQGRVTVSPLVSPNALDRKSDV